MGLPLFVDYRRRTLVQSELNPDSYALPPFTQNDGTPIEIVVLDSTHLGVRPTYTKRDLNYSVRVGLFLRSSGAQLAYQATFTSDAPNKKYTGNLTANSANQTTALTSSDEVECELEIEITSDGGANYETILPKKNGACVLVKERIATGASTVPANDTAVTVGNLSSLLAQLLESGFVLSNATAGKRLVHLDDNGQLQAAPIAES